jgi:hypothetical protein
VDRINVAAQWVGWREALLQQHAGTAKDDGQDIVEFVSDSAREAPNRFDSLRLEKLFLGSRQVLVGPS